MVYRHTQISDPPSIASSISLSLSLSLSLSKCTPSRWNDYVFVANDPRSLAALDKHVETPADEVALPLVVLGEPGASWDFENQLNCDGGGSNADNLSRPLNPTPPTRAGIGKSALLANWIQRRRARMHRDDFLFQHFVGASPSSCQLANLLGRLARALKAHYHLREMAVPESEERLRWALTRFLGAAAKKTWPSHLVIVIDGIDALKSEVASAADGGPSLHWLPTELPGNVRLVLAASALPQTQQQQAAAARSSKDAEEDGVKSLLQQQRLQQVLLPEDDAEEDGAQLLQLQQPALSTTTAAVEGGSGGAWGGRIVTELRRRGYPFLVMEPLTEAARGRIVDEFLRRCAAELGKTAATAATAASSQGGDQPQQQQQQQCLTLTPEQRARIVRAPATRRPLFLRMLLYALKLGVALSAHHSMTLDHQLDRYLGVNHPNTDTTSTITTAISTAKAKAKGKGTGTGTGANKPPQDDASAKALISEILDLSQQYVEGSGGGSPQVRGLLPRVLSAVYASRDGLSDEELRGLVELGMRQRLAVPLDAVVTVLDDMTILVKGLRCVQQLLTCWTWTDTKIDTHTSFPCFTYTHHTHTHTPHSPPPHTHRSFSHEAFRRVVYEKYIRTPEALVRQHELLARYFQRLPVLSTRKLSCLAHHLEVAGLWHKLRDALVDIDHFPLWWAPPRRKEFVALWASLGNRRAAAAAAAVVAAAAAGEAVVGGGGEGEQQLQLPQQEGLGVGDGGHGGRLVTGEFDEETMRAHQVRKGHESERRCVPWHGTHIQSTQTKHPPTPSLHTHIHTHTGAAALLRRGRRVRARRGGVAGAAPPRGRGAPAGAFVGFVGLCSV
jgi:hypothetical protein